jgi:hypothetical protein
MIILACNCTLLATLMLYVPAILHPLDLQDRDAVLAVSPDGTACQSRSEKSWGGGRATAGAYAGKVYYEVSVTYVTVRPIMCDKYDGLLRGLLRGGVQMLAVDQRPCFQLTRHGRRVTRTRAHVGASTT